MICKNFGICIHNRHEALANDVAPIISSSVLDFIFSTIQNRSCNIYIRGTERERVKEKKSRVQRFEEKIVNAAATK